MGKGPGASVPSKGSILPVSPHIHQPGSSSNPVHLRFNVSFITQALLISSLAFGDWIQSLAPLPPHELSVGGTESPHPVITMVVSFGNQPPSLGTFQKSLHWHNQRHFLYLALTAEISKGFRNSVQEMGEKTKYIFLVINHYVTFYTYAA